MILKIHRKDLSLQQIEDFNFWQHKEFHHTGATEETITQENKNDYKDDLFYFLTDDTGKTLAMVVLFTVEPVFFMKKDYQILTFTGLVATEKGKGYGKSLITEVKQDIISSGLSCFSFCHLEVFYEKCGFGIMLNTLNRFQYSGENCAIFDMPHIVYINGEDNLIESIINYPDEMVTLPIPWW